MHSFHLLKIQAKVFKSLSSKCSQKFLDHAKKTATDVLKNTSKRPIQKQ